MFKKQKGEPTTIPPNQGNAQQQGTGNLLANLLSAGRTSLPFQPAPIAPGQPLPTPAPFLPAPITPATPATPAPFLPAPIKPLGGLQIGPLPGQTLADLLARWPGAANLKGLMR